MADSSPSVLYSISVSPEPPASTPLYLHSPDDTEQDDNPQYDSHNIDKLLETSYVELDKIVERRASDQTPFNFNSGDSFFQRSNNLFHSDLGVGKCSKMCNKKVQCSIGAGFSFASESKLGPAETKQRRLEILKVIKLTRIIFKQLRGLQKKIKDQLQAELAKNQQMYSQCMESAIEMARRCTDTMAEKDMLIGQLKEDVERLSAANDKLTSKYELKKKESTLMQKEIENEKWKSLTEIDDISYQNNLKFEELNDRIAELQSNNSLLQLQVNSLSDTINTHQVHIKKLEYENGELDRQNKELSSKNEELLLHYEENEQKYNEQCYQLENTNESSHQLMKLNDLYLKQLQSRKRQISVLEEENYTLKKESEDIILQELNKYQEYFNNEMASIKKQYNGELFNKNNLIEEMKYKEKVYLSIIAEKDREISSRITLNVKHKDRFNTYGSRQNESGIGSQKNLALSETEIMSKSQKLIEELRESQATQTFSSLNHIRSPHQNRSILQDKMTFKKAISLIKQPKKKLIKDITNQSTQKTQEMMSKSRFSPIEELTFKAKEYSKGKKMSDYLAESHLYKEFTSSDGMMLAGRQIERMESKLVRLNQDLDRQLSRKHIH